MSKILIEIHYHHVEIQNAPSLDKIYKFHVGK